ncbi:MAG: transposase [Patescibacteria group bacterium]
MTRGEGCFYYHLAWHTRQRCPSIDQVSQPILLELLASEAAALGGEILASRCASDGVSLLCALPRDMPLAMMVHMLKGSSSHGLDLWRLPDFAWEDGYTAARVRPEDLEEVKAAVLREDCTAARMPA